MAGTYVWRSDVLADTTDMQTRWAASDKNRGTTGAARAPKPDNIPNTAARCHCLRRNLFCKIKVRPRSCRSYPIWHP